MKYFMEDYGVPIICGMIGAFIGIAIAYVAGWDCYDQIMVKGYDDADANKGYEY